MPPGALRPTSVSLRRQTLVWLARAFLPVCALESRFAPGSRPAPEPGPDGGLGALPIGRFAAQPGGTVQRGGRDGSYGLEIRIARLPGIAAHPADERG